MPNEYQFRFNLRQLVYFREVARRLHFREAAESLAVAQPALSRQIAQLEQALGARLFERTRRRVELTPAGRTLAEQIEPMLRTFSFLPRDIQAAAAGRTGRIAVSFTGLAMATVLPGILREFHRKNPHVRVELNESPTSAQLAALAAGDIDCGFFHPDAPTPGLKTRELLRERNGVVLPPGSTLAKKKILKLMDLRDLPFVLFPRGNNPGFYDRILAACTKAGITLRIAEEVWPRANGIGLVRAGIGATFMTRSEARHLAGDLGFRDLSGPAPESRLVLGWRRSPEPTPVLAEFLKSATDL